MVLVRPCEVFKPLAYDYLLEVAVIDVLLHLPHLCCLWELCLLHRSHVGRPGTPSQEREMAKRVFQGVVITAMYQV